MRARSAWSGYLPCVRDGSSGQEVRAGGFLVVYFLSVFGRTVWPVTLEMKIPTSPDRVPWQSASFPGSEVIVEPRPFAPRQLARAPRPGFAGRPPASDDLWQQSRLGLRGFLFEHTWPSASLTRPSTDRPHLGGHQLVLCLVKRNIWVRPALTRQHGRSGPRGCRHRFDRHLSPSSRCRSFRHSWVTAVRERTRGKPGQMALPPSRVGKVVLCARPVTFPVVAVVPPHRATSTGDAPSRSVRNGVGAPRSAASWRDPR